MIDIFPYTVWSDPWLAPCALALDLIFGDPPMPWPHPVCFPGRLMHLLEKRARIYMDKGPGVIDKKNRGLFAGLLSLFVLLSIMGFLTRILLAVPYLECFFALYLAWAGLAMGCLLHTGKIVLEKIENSPLPEARIACSWLVSRDVSTMNQTILRKTLADTLSENFTDAFVAPFFWLLCTGPVGLWLYKTVSTMDSQWGYLTPEWKYLGFAGAKGDDLLAWLPARISILLLFITDKVLTRFPSRKIWKGFFPAFHTIASQAIKMPSPNSGWSMSACAWLCAGNMAGPSVYFGELVVKPWLGPKKMTIIPWDRPKLLALCSLLLYGAIIGGFVLWLGAWVTGSSVIFFYKNY